MGLIWLFDFLEFWSLFDKWETFKALSLVKGLFEQVKVDIGG